MASTWLVILTGYPGKDKGLFPGDSKALFVRLRRSDSHTYRARSTWGTLISDVRDDEISCGLVLTTRGGRLWDVLAPRCITVDRLNGIRILTKL